MKYAKIKCPGKEIPSDEVYSRYVLFAHVITLNSDGIPEQDAYTYPEGSSFAHFMFHQVDFMVLEVSLVKCTG